MGPLTPMGKTSRVNHKKKKRRGEIERFVRRGGALCCTGDKAGAQRIKVIRPVNPKIFVGKT